MRRLCSLPLVVFALSGCASSTPAPAPPPEPELNRPKSPEAFMWSVQCPNLEGTTTLIGSIHLRRQEDRTLPEAFSQAIDTADLVAFEVDEPSVIQLVGLLYRLGAFAFTQKTSLPEATWQKLMPRLQTLGIDRERAGYISEWGLIFLVMMADLDPHLTPETGIDILMKKYATAADKELAYVETVESQLRLFSDLPKEDQKRMLEASLSEQAELSDIVELYRVGDILALERLTREGMAEFPEFTRRVFDDRNVVFADFAQEQMASGVSGTIVAGAGHMVGPKGIPALLFSRGCTVEPEPLWKAQLPASAEQAP